LDITASSSEILKSGDAAQTASELKLLSLMYRQIDSQFFDDAMKSQKIVVYEIDKSAQLRQFYLMLHGWPEMIGKTDLPTAVAYAELLEVAGNEFMKRSCAGKSS
jgi:hypothetical protein